MAIAFSVANAESMKQPLTDIYCRVHTDIVYDIHPHLKLLWPTFSCPANRSARFFSSPHERGSSPPGRKGEAEREPLDFNCCA